jgi:mannose-6-phosphate isomerase-like protein (cupin superfamily)
MTMQKVNLNDKFDLINEYWQPRVAGELNGQQIKIAKLKGEFIWHHHENEDEFFMVIKGNLKIALPEQEISLDEGEFFIVPRGIEHKPIADEEVWVMMFEPTGTLNTGNVRSELTKEELESI